MQTILIVDDDEGFLDSMSRILQQHYATHACSGGVEGLAWATTHQPDLILLDIMMDDMDGYEVCRQLKERPETRDIPVIFTTALDSAGDETHGLLLGAIDYISKPVNPSITLARIANHLKLKRHEDALRTLNLTMEDAVRRRTAELSAALEAAKSADQAKDEFLANMSHELRTPLNAVIGMAGLARSLSTEPRQREYLDKITTSGKHLNRIINDLLDLSKIVAGRMEFENLPFSLRALIQESNASMATRAAEKGLVLGESIDDAVPDVLRGDPLRVKQILLNLVGNAIKFTAQGRVDVGVSLNCRDEARVCLDITVDDTGIGMRPDDLNRLFKPFTQADATVSRQFGGTGLGLAISRRLAEMMDGDISVTSREGSGTSFCARLWLGLGEADELLAISDAGRESARVRYQNARVLVVDDQPFNRDVVEGLLVAVGITPRLAENGRQAVDILVGGAEDFDLVLMDVQMPVMDGLTATRAIRAMEGFAKLPIIALTAHTMAHEKEKGVAAGMNDHIGKPFDEAGFYRALAKWIPLYKQCLQATVEAPAAASSGLPSLQGVDVRAGLALLQGNEPRYRQWLGVFIAEMPVTMGQLRQALDAGQSGPASLIAHTLKGRTGLLGMNGLHVIATDIEAAIDAAQPTRELLLVLEREVAAMCDEIRRGLGKGGKQ
jgi:two-component system sensor histidine kinase/response regulator